LLGGFGFIDTTGNIIIEPKYLKVGNFSGGLAWIRNTEGKIGFINHKGEEVIKPTYLAVKNFDPFSGIAFAKDQVGWKYIDTNGITLKTEAFEAKKMFIEGLAMVKKNGLWGFIGPDGNYVVEPKYKSLTKLQYGYARFKVKGKWGVLNKKGEIVIEPIYKDVKEFYPINGDTKYMRDYYKEVMTNVRKYSRYLSFRSLY
jgi:hypothetical protein